MCAPIATETSTSLLFTGLLGKLSVTKKCSTAKNDYIMQVILNTK